VNGYLVLDPEFMGDVAGGESASAGRHLVLDAEYLAQQQREAEAQPTVFLYE